MPRRKGSPYEEALDNLVRKHAKVREAAAPPSRRRLLRPMFEALALGDALDDLMAFGLGDEPPYRATDEQLERWSTARIVRLTDALIGKLQRTSGGKSKGVRRETYKGRPIPSREQMRAKVQAVADQHPSWYRSQVYRRAASDLKYESADSVKKACKEPPGINWGTARPVGRRSKTY
jgi:hypothetical protein